MEESVPHSHADEPAQCHELADAIAGAPGRAGKTANLTRWSFPLSLLISIALHALLLAVAWAFVPTIAKHVLRNPLMVFQDGEQNVGDPSAPIGMELPSEIEVIPAPIERPPVELPQTDLPDAPPIELAAAEVQLPASDEPLDDVAPGPVGVVADVPLSMNPYLPQRTGPAAAIPTAQATEQLASAPIPAGVYTPPTVARGVAGRRGIRGGLDGRGLPTPEYPAEARRRGQEGVVELEVVVNPDGSIGDVKVRSDPGFPLLVEAAKAALKNARFDPATRDGVAVAGPLIIPFRFTLD